MYVYIYIYIYIHTHTYTNTYTNTTCNIMYVLKMTPAHFAAFRQGSTQAAGPHLQETIVIKHTIMNEHK